MPYKDKFKQSEWYRRWYQKHGRSRSPTTNEDRKRYRQENPDIYRCALEVERMRKFIVRPETCPICGEAAKTQLHHPDHSKPFTGVMCCAKCHKRIEVGMIPCPDPKPIEIADGLDNVLIPV